MLEQITIQNLGVIKEARLAFSPGLNIITGETGAGKTMVLTGLNLLMGKRASAQVVRNGAAHASVDGCWLLHNYAGMEAIEATGAVMENDVELFINRTVAADGKSRAVMGGKTTPTGILAEATAGLVNIHGQADQLRLKSTDAQLEALDRFGGAAVAKAMKSYQATYRTWRDAAKRLSYLQENAATLAFEHDRLVSFLRDYDDLAPEPGELDELEREISTLSHLDDLRHDVAAALGVLDPEYAEGLTADAALREVTRIVSGMASIAPSLKATLEQLTEAAALLASASASLEDYRDELDGDSIERLYQAQERHLALKNFTRKHFKTLEELAPYAEDCRRRVDEIDPDSLDIEALSKELASLEASCSKMGATLTAARLKAAEELTGKVNDELAGLAMAGNQFVVQMNGSSSFGPRGVDDVAFMLTMNGSPVPRPINRAASGGELSRIMLAMEVVLADPDLTPTFVFDEVDSGVGGATAIEIGKRLARLAQDAQVIVVSHLPQVAAFADAHLLVSKTVEKDSVETSVHTLSSEARVEEITRMLSGMAGSATGAAHAEELLAMAEPFRVSSCTR